MSDVSAGFCPACYAAGIGRLCAGYTWQPAGSREGHWTPPLPPDLAAGVRRAADVQLTIRGYKTGALHNHGPGAVAA